ncbi:vitamin K epoxide reductase family protein [Schumannella soli]|uniref:Vitamin K epoxide reductase family protein n=1 Tax=Schumannella soli TaxID=2590779 RepID=A0A506Y2A3_9MICO|nr:vitamin K epoxide reductase family protein [Schumannella soli]
MGSASACEDASVTDTVAEAPTSRRSWIFAVFLIVAGALGWWAAFNLTLDKIAVLEDPNAALSCNVSAFVQCGKNLDSWQGSVFGFPNPLLGLGGFVAPIAVGVALLAGARFARWFWIAFNVGIVGALAFVIWLITQSFFSLGTLCPWCALVWSVTIPLFWATSLRNAKEGVFGDAPRRIGRLLTPWIVPITVACYLIVIVIGQIRIPIIQSLFL